MFLHVNFYMFLASSPLYFITALTSLFESIAMIVVQHQPVVEKYYGTGQMKDVVQRLLDECDRVVKDVLERWQEERSMSRKVSHSFSLWYILIPCTCSFLMCPILQLRGDRLPL